MKTLLISSLLLVILTAKTHVATAQPAHEFPPLPYPYSALEAFIDATTMEIHYSRHHRGYFNNFVKGVEENNLGGIAIEDIFARVSELPITIRNNGGGHYNHNLFWKIMSPYGGDTGAAPKLLDAIKITFGSWESFVGKFQAAALGQFGSGWAWLSVNSQGNLFVSSTPNQDNPLMDVAGQRGTPILGLDVWEHAYYLRYQNRRADYVANFWKVVNWAEVERRYKELVK